MKKQSWPFLPLACAGFALILLAVFLFRTLPRPGVIHAPVWNGQTQTTLSPEQTEPMFPIDVNTAPARELAYLPGIGPAIAENIVAYRDENGPYGEPDDLLAVSGIGQHRLEQILPYITTGGYE